MRVYVSNPFSTAALDHRFATFDSAHYEVIRLSEDAFRVNLVGEEGDLMKRFPEIEIYPSFDAATDYVLDQVRALN